MGKAILEGSRKDAAMTLYLMRIRPMAFRRRSSMVASYVEDMYDVCRKRYQTILL